MAIEEGMEPLFERDATKLEVSLKFLKQLYQHRRSFWNPWAFIKGVECLILCDWCKTHLMYWAVCATSEFHGLSYYAKQIVILTKILLSRIRRKPTINSMTTTCLNKTSLWIIRKIFRVNQACYTESIAFWTIISSAKIIRCRYIIW